jgi:hypothetical protein
MSTFIPALPGYQMIWLEGEARKENVYRSDVIGWKLSDLGGPIPVGVKYTGEFLDGLGGWTAVLAPDGRVYVNMITKPFEDLDEWLGWVKERIEQELAQREAELEKMRR